MAERDLIINLVVKGGDTSSQQLEKVAQSEQDVAVSATAANKALDQQSKELTDNNKATKELVKQQQTLKDRLKEIKLELQRLAIAGKQNTEEYKRLKAEGGNLVDVLGDVNDELRQAGSDTKGLDKVIRVASTATAAFGLVQGAAALFGDENEELQKSLLKVNAALTVLTSLQQIQEELNRKDSLFTAAAAKAKLFYATAVGASTGALRLFRLALIATGIGGIVVLVGLLIANWDKLTQVIGKSLPNLTKYADKFKAFLQDVTDLIGLTDPQEKAISAQVKALEKQNKELERQAALLSAQENNIAAAEKRLQIAQNQVKILELQNEEKEKIKDAVNDEAIAQVNLSKAIEDANEKEKEKNKTDEQANGILAKRKRELEEINKQIAELDALSDSNLIGKLFGERAQLEKFISDAERLQQIRIDIEKTKLINPEELDNAESLGAAITLVDSLLQRLSEDAPQRNGLLILFTELNKQLEATKTNLDNIKNALADNGEAAKKAVQDAINEFNKNPVPSPFANAETPEQIKARRQNEIREEIQKAQIIAEGTLAVFRQAQAARQQILDNRLKQGLITEQEYEQEVAKLRRKEAIATKLQGIFNATISGIEAFNAALKFGPVFAGVVAALAAAQVAAIAATPIPKFRKGGDVDILKGGREKLGQLFGNSHEQGGILIEAEGGEHITRKSMAKKYRPLLHAINSDTVDTFLKLNTLAMPMPKRLSNTEIRSGKQAEKRMAELIEEVRFLSQYVRQGNKYAKVTADNTQDLKTAKKYHRV